MASTSSASNSKVTTAYLKQIVGSPVGKFYKLSRSDVTIGRSNKSGIFISDPNISRSHCSLKFIKDNWTITDLGSVNGTYLDGTIITSGVSEILKEGTAIYIGPPSEAPVAFMFFNNKNGHQVNRTDRNNSQQSNSDVSAASTSSGLRNGNHSQLKRKIDSVSEYTTSISLLIKRLATTSNDNSMPEPSATSAQNSDECNNMSDCSISSLDSLNTRIRKLSYSKEKSKQKPNAKNKGISNFSSPTLRAVKYNQHAPSTSTRSLPYSMPDVNEKLTIIKAGKSDLLLDEILNENTHPSQETNADHENSESLLNDSKILFDFENDPSSQHHEANEPHAMKSKSKFHREGLQCDEELESNKEMNLYTTLEKKLIAQLRKTKLFLQKTIEDKRNLIDLVEAQRSFEKTKDKEKIPKEEFMKLLEEDLFCNICTEIFIKATTLGCAHTFCEHCINEWKTKRKSCPICREKIITETRILVMDNFVDKIVELLGEDYKKKRQEVIESRSKEKAVAKKSRRKKGRAQRQGHPDASILLNTSMAPPPRPDSIAFHLSPTGQHLPFRSVIQLYSEPEESPSSIDILSSNYMDYCYNCGRRDHWAIECPFN